LENTKKTLWEVAAMARDELSSDRVMFFLIANAYIYICENNIIDNKKCHLLSIAEEMNKYLSDELLEKIGSLLSNRSLDEIRHLIYEILSGRYFAGHSFIESSNNSISELAYELLGIDDAGHDVFDLGSGTGNFLANTYKLAHENQHALKSLIGLELNSEQAQISQMALDILVDDTFEPIILTGSALDKPKYRYTKGYVFPPFGIKQMLSEQTKKSLMFPDLRLTNRNTTEWFFIDSLLSGLEGRGEAVALVTGRALFNDADKEYRSRLIKEGWLEGIIELPSGSLSFTGIKVYVLIFSSSNKTVKFVDASDVLENEPKRYNKVELPVETILSLYKNSSVKLIKNEELINSSNLMPSNILLDVVKPKNGVPLSKIANVFTGSQYTIRNFEDISSKARTGYQILTSSDIDDGMVDWHNLQSIDYKDTKFDKFSVKKNDVIITSKSSKVKTVVVDINPKEKILVTGGMIIVRPDIAKLNPTYLKIFLDSEQGQKAIKEIQKGVTIITINAKDLSNILIPLIDIKKQEAKAENYNRTLSTLFAYKQEIKKLEMSLKNNFLDESEE
jgi:type I restriction enzyme M protein